MKKLKTYKELTLEDAVKLTGKQLKECAFSDEKDKARRWIKPFEGLLSGILFKDKCSPFTDGDGDAWQYCALIEERYPRDVPEGVKPLPDDKPFLAYVGELNIAIPIAAKAYTYIGETSGWLYCIRECVLHREHVAIDVSTEWAKENFPDIVDAMEYEAIYEHSLVPERLSTLKYHKLGDKTYDLNWNKIGKDEATDQFVEDNKMVEEPPDFRLWEKHCDIPARKTPLLYGEGVFKAGEAVFKAGVARKEWEMKQWKYATAEDAYKSEELKHLYGMPFERFKAIFDAAREMKED